MDNPRPEKVAIVAEVRDKFDGCEAVVLTEYRGLNVRELAELRTALRSAGGEYKIYKNTMVRFAAKDLDLDLDELLVGPTALAFTTTRDDGSAGDAVTVAKALTEFRAGNDKLVIKGGLLDGQPLSVEQIDALSKIAPRGELLSRLAGGLAAPMQQFAALLSALPQNLAYAIAALIEQQGGVDESAPAPDDDGGADDVEAPADGDAGADDADASAEDESAPVADGDAGADDADASAEDESAPVADGDAGADDVEASNDDAEESADGGDSKES